MQNCLEMKKEDNDYYEQVREIELNNKKDKTNIKIQH